VLLLFDEPVVGLGVFAATVLLAFDRAVGDGVASSRFLHADSASAAASAVAVHAKRIGVDVMVSSSFGAGCPFA
jgi:hypothetical protein